MEKFMVAVLFFLGVGLIFVAIIALFRKVASGEGSLEFAGIKLSGKGAPIFLLSGVLVSFSGFSWYHSLNQVHTLKQTVASTQSEREEFADAASKLKHSLDQETTARRTLEAQLPPERIEQLRRAQPSVFEMKQPQLTPKVMEELRRRPIR